MYFGMHFEIGAGDTSFFLFLFLFFGGRWGKAKVRADRQQGKREEESKGDKKVTKRLCVSWLNQTGTKGKAKVNQERWGRESVCAVNAEQLHSTIHFKDCYNVRRDQRTRKLKGGNWSCIATKMWIKGEKNIISNSTTKHEIKWGISKERCVSERFFFTCLLNGEYETRNESGKRVPSRFRWLWPCCCYGFFLEFGSSLFVSLLLSRSQKSRNLELTTDLNQTT